MASTGDGKASQRHGSARDRASTGVHTVTILEAVQSVLDEGTRKTSDSIYMEVKRKFPGTIPEGVDVATFADILRSLRKPAAAGDRVYVLPHARPSMEAFDARKIFVGTELEDVLNEEFLANIQLVRSGLRRAFLFETAQDSLNGYTGVDIRSSFHDIVKNYGLDTLPQNYIGRTVNRFFVFRRDRPLPRPNAETRPDAPVNGLLYTDPEVAVILGFVSKGIPDANGDTVAVRLNMYLDGKLIGNIMTEILDVNEHPDYDMVYDCRKDAFTRELKRLWRKVTVQVDVERIYSHATSLDAVMKAYEGGTIDDEVKRKHAADLANTFPIYSLALPITGKPLDRVMFAVFWTIYDPMEPAYPIIRETADAIDDACAVFMSSTGDDVKRDILELVRSMLKATMKDGDSRYDRTEVERVHDVVRELHVRSIMDLRDIEYDIKRYVIAIRDRKDTA